MWTIPCWSYEIGAFNVYTFMPNMWTIGLHYECVYAFGPRDEYGFLIIGLGICTFEIDCEKLYRYYKPKTIA